VSRIRGSISSKKASKGQRWIPKASPTTSISTPRVSFGHIFTATEHYIVQDQRKQRKSGQAQTKDQLAEAKNAKLASRLNNRFAESFEKSRVTLHFDGKPSEQKNLAHKERTTRRETQVKKSQCSILKTQLVIHSDVNASSKRLSCVFAQVCRGEKRQESVPGDCSSTDSRICLCRNPTIRDGISIYDS